MLEKILNQKIKESSPLSAEDLKYMRKLGFANKWIALASEHGAFSLGPVCITWNLAWTRRSNFFYEVAKNALPVGIDDSANLIYLSDIESPNSKIGILSSEADIFITVANNFDNFLNSIDTFNSSDLRTIMKERIASRETFSKSVEFNIKNSKVGDVFDFFPFGKNTEGRITNQTGEYIAVYHDYSMGKKRAKRKSCVYLLFLITFSVIYFYFLNKLNFSVSVLIILYVYILFSLIWFHSFNGKLSGNWRRL